MRPLWTRKTSRSIAVAATKPSIGAWTVTPFRRRGRWLFAAHGPISSRGAWSYGRACGKLGGRSPTANGHGRPGCRARFRAARSPGVPDRSATPHGCLADARPSPPPQTGPRSPPPARLRDAGGFRSSRDTRPRTGAFPPVGQRGRWPGERTAPPPAVPARPLRVPMEDARTLITSCEGANESLQANA